MPNPLNDRCKHGLPRAFCALCSRPNHPTRALPEYWPNVSLKKLNGNFALDIDDSDLDRHAGRILVQESGQVSLAKHDSSGEVLAIEEAGYEVTRALLQMVSRASGIYFPRYALTLRETFAARASRCWHCHDLFQIDRELTLGDYYPGCSLGCRYYVCGCGFCLCDLPDNRSNYLGQFHPKAGPGSGLLPYNRSLYVKAAHWLAEQLTGHFPQRPFLKYRRDDLHVNVEEWCDQVDEGHIVLLYETEPDRRISLLTISGTELLSLERSNVREYPWSDLIR